MPLAPISKTKERVELAKQDSDSAYFTTLLYLGELLTKLVTAGLVAGIADDRERHRYRQVHRLIRADGLGEWIHVLDDVLTGPPAQHLIQAVRSEARELTQRHPIGTWQFDASDLMFKCLFTVDPTSEELPTRVDARRCLSMFVQLRNKTRGHGAVPSHVLATLAPKLDESLMLFINNFSLFGRSWAFLHRNLSGTYRVTPWTHDHTPFAPLKQKVNRPGLLPDGVYVYYEQPIRVELVHSDPDALDFYFPNGAFTDKCYEVLSYTTGNKQSLESAPFLTPATELPPSTTQGVGSLDVQGKSFGNLPPQPSGYIRRLTLENELRAVLNDTQRYPIVTLVGRGGIGKTSLALHVLHELADTTRFGALLWFSARDIDLLPQGPKTVKPQVLTEQDIAAEFVRLMEPAAVSEKTFKAVAFLSECLQKSPLNEPLLYIFDNFETVRNPEELFAWIDTYVRLPNKVLITSRFRHFKADYPVEVVGMTEDECKLLIDVTASSLSLSALLTDDYRKELYCEADGHPYVIKMLLGEVAKAGKLVKVEKLVASKDDILDALFERTYSRLSPAARQVFLTLCNWRSVVPQLALEAVMLRSVNERIDVQEAVEELRRSSFVEVAVSAGDSAEFLSVPLAALVFGKRKLAVSPMKSSVEANTELLRYFGAAQRLDIRHGIAPRIDRLVSNVATRVSRGGEKLDDYLPMLEFLGRKYPPMWLLLASLHEEFESRGAIERAKEAIRRYLESGPSDQERIGAWERLATLCRRTDDWTGECQALVEMCQLMKTPFELISNCANRLNSLFRLHPHSFDAEEKRVIVRRLVETMESRIGEADANDLGRLAWLCLHLHDKDRAARITERGLGMEPANEHLCRLQKRLLHGSDWDISLGSRR